MKLTCISFALTIGGIFLLQIEVITGAKILFFMGLSGYSHRVALQPLANRLAEIGHEITFLTPIKIIANSSNSLKSAAGIKEFCPSLLWEMNRKIGEEQGNEAILGRLKDKYYNPFFEKNSLWDLLYNFSEAVVASPDFAQWLNNNGTNNESKFDLVITEHPSKEVSFGVAYKLKAKVIAFMPSPHLMTEDDMFGLPTESSWLPDITMGRSSYYYEFIPESYVYAYNTISFYLSYTWQYLPRLDSLLRDHLGEGIPPVEQLIRNTSLYFVNLHFSNEYARSIPPFVVPVGGMHIQEEQEILPQEIIDFTGGNETHGFIYISFGSLIKISALPSETLQVFFDSMKSFKNIKFLWKWEGDISENLPTNILTMKWLPQQQILAHPQCKGFISQGGLMSFQQASYFGVPLIIIPVFWDQPFNARVGVHHGIAIHLELSEISFYTLSHAISQILYNHSYSSRASEVSKRFRDRPMSALDTAVWWTEYVLRHDDLSHLKPLGIHQYWWQRRQLDFWAVVFSLVFLIILIFILLAYIVIRTFTF